MTKLMRHDPPSLAASRQVFSPPAITDAISFSLEADVVGIGVAVGAVVDVVVLSATTEGGLSAADEQALNKPKATRVAPHCATNSCAMCSGSINASPGETRGMAVRVILRALAVMQGVAAREGRHD
jgi:hypothetical protein